MKAIIQGNSLYVNTFDTRVIGNAIFGKILEISLTEKISVKLQGTDFHLQDTPSCAFPKVGTWNHLIDRGYEVFHLESSAEDAELFWKTANDIQKYFEAASQFMDENDKFPERIIEEI